MLRHEKRTCIGAERCHVRKYITITYYYVLPRVLNTGLILTQLYKSVPALLLQTSSASPNKATPLTSLTGKAGAGSIAGPGDEGPAKGKQEGVTPQDTAQGMPKVEPLDLLCTLPLLLASILGSLPYSSFC